MLQGILTTTQATGHELQELVIGQIISSRKPWTANVHLGLLVGLVVVGSHPKKEKDY